MSARVAVLAIVPLVATLPADIPSFEGTWAGSAEIIVSWTVQRRLDVTLAIDSSGYVSGCVGNALAAGRVSRNRGALLRVMDWKTDFIIDARLTGPIIVAEGVARDRVRMPFNLVDGRIEGGIHTSGSKVRGKHSGILTARRLVLRRVGPFSQLPRNHDDCAAYGVQNADRPR